MNLKALIDSDKFVNFQGENQPKIVWKYQEIGKDPYNLVIAYFD